jgi:hypothetical protein
MITIFPLDLLGLQRNEHMLSALWPEPNKNTQPVSVKPFVDTGDIRPHTSQNIDNPRGLKAPWSFHLVEQGLNPFRQFDA